MAFPGHGRWAMGLQGESVSGRGVGGARGALSRGRRGTYLRRFFLENTYVVLVTFSPDSTQPAAGSGRESPVQSLRWGRSLSPGPHSSPGAKLPSLRAGMGLPAPGPVTVPRPSHPSGSAACPSSHLLLASPGRSQSRSPSHRTPLPTAPASPCQKHYDHSQPLSSCAC